MHRLPSLALVIVLGGALSSTAQAQRKLEDGTWVVSPLVVAAEMIVDEVKAKRKYAGQALQLEGPMSEKLITDRGLDLTIMAQPPGYLGYKKFWCRSSHKPSEQAAASLAIGQKVMIVGIYEPNTRRETTAMEIQESADKGADWSAAIRLDSCVVLTGNPHADIDRAAVASEAAGAQEQKK